MTRRTIPSRDSGLEKSGNQKKENRVRMLLSPWPLAARSIQDPQLSSPMQKVPMPQVCIGRSLLGKDAPREKAAGKER